MKKFTLVDYIIIILVICAIAFAFIHISSDDTSNVEKTAYDVSTINKIPDTYLNYYKDGFIVKSTVTGFNASTGEEITINGTIVWEDDDGGSDVKLLIESDDGETYLLGLYRYVPNADIYIDSISLEVDGSKYSNLTEITLKPKNINSIIDLTANIDNNSNYEITTKIAIDSLTTSQLQDITNKINSNNKRVAVKTATNDADNQLLITRADSQNIKDTDSILGNINGISDEITIRIHDCSNKQLTAFENNPDVINIRTF